MPTLRVFRALALATALAAAGGATAQEPARTPGGIVIDFQDADIRAVITALAEAGRINVVFGELPERRVTLRVRQAVAPAQVLPLLRGLVEANGLVMVEGQGGLVRIEAPVGRTPGGAAPELRLFVHRLKHARAARLAVTLQSLFGAQLSATDAQLGLGTTPLSEQLRRQNITPLDIDTIGRGATPQTGIPIVTRGELQIVPDETTNSLLIRASPTEYETIRQAIEALDLRPLQTMIEVLVAEVRRSKDLDASTSAFIRDRDAGVAVSSGPPFARDSSSAADFLVRIARRGDLTVNVAIRALAARGDVRILSRPLLLAQNNEEARILVGSQRPFVQVFRSLPTDAAVRDQVVQYRDVGTSLTIRPTINPDGYVSLQLAQEVSSATAETQFGAPVISTREASTTLFVRDGQTAVIGGLVDRLRERVRSGVPYLIDIPVIGFLFGTVRDANVQSELFLLLTPHIVQTDADIDRVRRAVEQREIGGELPKNPPVVPPSRPPER